MKTWIAVQLGIGLLVSMLFTSSARADELQDLRKLVAVQQAQITAIATELASVKTLLQSYVKKETLDGYVTKEALGQAVSPYAKASDVVTCGRWVNIGTSSSNYHMSTDPDGLIHAKRINAGEARQSMQIKCR